MSISQTIRKKRAVRQYENKPVPQETIQQILDTARWSQSSKNTQPWQFVVVTDKAVLGSLSDAGNFTKHVTDSAFTIVLVSENDQFWRGFDLGQVAMCLQLAAHEHGIGSCPIAFHRPEQAKVLLGIPMDKAVHAGITFGYPARTHTPAKMGGRRKVDELTHWNNWTGS